MSAVDPTALAIRLRSLPDAQLVEALQDALTGLWTRTAARHVLDAHPCRAVAMIDLRLLKAVNDTHGHAAGDALLRLAADLLRTHIRQGDVFRHGGDEFLAVCSAEDAEAIELRLREVFDGRHGVTASVGVALDRSGEAAIPDAVLEEADARMYDHKRSQA